MGRSPAARIPVGDRKPVLSLCAVGLLTLIAQVVLLRELAVAFFGVELVYLLGLGLWLAAGAAGAACSRPDRAGPSEDAGVLFLALALLLPAAIAFLRSVRLVFAPAPGAYLPLAGQLGAAALALGPAGWVSGALFRRVGRVFLRKGGTIAVAYAWESAGALAGGLLATASFRLGIQNFAVAGCCALGASLAAGALCEGRCRRWAAGAALSCLALLAGSGPLDRWMTGWNHPDLVMTADSPYGRVTVTESQGQVSVFQDDALAFETQGVDAEAFVHPAALQVKSPRRVLVLGGGLRGLVPEVLQHGPSQVDCVELDRVVFRRVAARLPPDARPALDDARVRWIFDDPRRVLEAESRYDLILVAMPEPSSGQTNRFYTREFFSKCAARLSPGGVLAFRLRSAENYWSPQLLRRNASVHRALAAVFGDVLVLPGDADVFLASAARLIRDGSALAGRLRERAIRARLVTPEYLGYLYTNDRVAGAARSLETADAPPNADSRPVCYQYGAFLWLAQFVPWASRADPGRWSALPWVALALAAGLLALARGRCRRIVLAALAGLAGMVCESVLLLGYQMTRGVVFQDIGFLLFCFMAGLALGAKGFEAAAARAGKWLGAAALGAFVLLEAALSWVASSGSAPGLAGTAVLLGAAGALAAGLFAWAGRGELATREDAPRLYAADLFGGCAGALAAGFFLIPTLGLDGTALWVAFLTAAGVLLM